MNCIQKREVNLGSLSETIEVGTPWTEKIRSMRRLAVSTAVMFWETGMRSVNPVKRSDRTRMSFFLLSLGKGSAKSVAIEENGSLGTGRGVTTLLGWVVGCLLIWQR